MRTQENCRRRERSFNTKLKHLKITLNETVVNELVNFSIENKFRPLYRVGVDWSKTNSWDFAAQKKQYVNQFL
jgi:GTP pyrophosphokinase